MSRDPALHALAAYGVDLSVRRNYPYAGTSDGLTAYLRLRFPADAYAGIELKINQKHVVQSGRHWSNGRDAVTRALRQVVADINRRAGSASQCDGAKRGPRDLASASRGWATFRNQRSSTT